MSKHWRYFKYVCKHKWFVFYAGLGTRAPLWRLIIHDYSKFSRTEWSAYANRFYGGRSGLEDKTLDPEAFKLGWLHHLHRNPHHWLYWVLMLEDGTKMAFEMPEKLVREMVADWMGAGRAITGQWDLQEWWDANKKGMLFHPNTRIKVYKVLEGQGYKR